MITKMLPQNSKDSYATQGKWTMALHREELQVQGELEEMTEHAQFLPRP